MQSCCSHLFQSVLCPQFLNSFEVQVDAFLQLQSKYRTVPSADNREIRRLEIKAGLLPLDMLV